MRNDILFDEQGNPVETDGDFTDAQSDEQHIIDLFETGKCEIPDFPFVGFGAEQKINMRVNAPRFVRQLKNELELDNYGSAKIETDGNLSNLKIIYNNI